ncbi:MAG: nucleotide exchange factor GrpE [Hyphomonadaceae bacterium]|nr:nucleotide exchange factor GrpE [Hyphomonadaceae bacterium]
MSEDANHMEKDGPTDDAKAIDVAALQTELAKAKDDMLRALAEAENTRRRAERQVSEARTYAIDRFAGDLLPVADTLARALQAAPRNGADEALNNLLTGLELTERTLIDTFSRHGLKRVGAKGDAFDPNIHQAVAQAPSDQAPGIILEVMQPGYMLGDRTLRAAMVLVSAGGQTHAATVDIKV